jgi:WD40 repeat protein
LGVKLEEGLAERILQDLGQEPGALPLLEFALTQLWERQQYRQLTHTAYEAIGGVTQALARHADATLARFQNERERLRRVFVQLVRPGEGTEDTRQVATREQVGADNWSLVTELADERLVVTGRDAQGQETVEVVHEALLRHWQPLRQWIELDRQFRVWQNRLRLALQEWQEKKRDEGALLRGARLAEAEERLSKYAEELSQAEKNYIEASIVLREREAVIRRRARQRVIAGLAAGLVVALMLSGLATWQWWEAIKQRNLTLARQLAAQAGLRLDNSGAGLLQSALLVTESLQRDPTPYAYTTWARTMDLLPHHQPIQMAHEGGVLSVTFSPDGQRLATASGDNTARVWDAANGRELARLTHEGRVWNVVFSPDGRRLASASNDHTARVWDTASGRELARLIHEDGVSSVAFSPDGQRLATASGDKTARIWNAASGRELARLIHEGTVLSVTFSPDGRRLATASDDKTARVWDAASGRGLARLTHEEMVWNVVFSLDGRRLASASNDHTARVPDAVSGRELARLTHGHTVQSVAFSPDGQRLATASWDKTARVRDAASGRELVRLSHEGGVSSVAFSPDGQRLATASWDKTARVWDAASGRELIRLLHEGMVASVAFSPDGQRLATASNDHTARVWDAASGRELARLTHEGSVQSVAFSLDGQRLATASIDNTAQIWLWRAEDLIAEACKRLPRNLTHQEWRQYVGEEVPYHATCPNLPVPTD